MMMISNSSRAYPAMTLVALLVSTLSSAAFAERNIQYTYTAQGLVETIDGPRTDVTDITAFEYDQQGNLIKVTNALGHITEITSHDASGRPLTIIDANGVSTLLTYDARGRLTSLNHAGSLTQLSYDAVGNLLQVVRPNNLEINYQYDDAHRLIGLSDALGNSITYTLDNAGNRVSEDITDPTDTLTYTHQYVYDELSRLRNAIGAEAQTTTLTYDVNNNLTEEVNPRSYATQFAVDALDRLSTVTNAQSGLTAYSYDARNNLTHITDPRGNTTTYTYDGFDNLITQQSPDTGLTTYTYDDAGNRLTQTDARGITTTYNYGALNRLISVSYPDSSLDVTYVYDENSSGQYGIGRLTTLVDASGITQYRYDERGNLIEKTVQYDNLTFTLAYEYNQADQLTQLTYPDGRSINYFYDAAGQVSSVDTTDSQDTTQTLLSNIQYAPFGPVSTQTLGNGLVMTQGVDQSYRLTDLTVSGVTDRAYNVDPNSNITQIDDATTLNNQLFGYDSLDRLVMADAPSYGDIDYAYDANHNRTSKTQTLNALTDSETYQYPATSNQLSLKSNGLTSSYSYDAMGNIIDNGEFQFTYSDAGRLSYVTQNGVAVASYTYNALGQRTQKNVGSDTIYFLYGEQGELLAEIGGSGSQMTNYVFVNQQLQAMMIGSNTTPPNLPTEIILDNTDAVYSDNWPTSSNKPGYIGADYQYHANTNTSPQPKPLGTPIDNTQATFQGIWTSSTANQGYYASDYQHRYAGVGENVVTWSISQPMQASYDVYASWSAGSNRATNAKYTINHASGTDTVSVNQRQNGGQWNLLGTYTLEALSSVSLSDDADGYVIADAISVVPTGTNPDAIPHGETATWSFSQIAPAEYQLFVNWSADSGRTSNAHYTIVTANGVEHVNLNQRQNGDMWNLLGTYSLDNNSALVLSSEGNGFVIADGVKLVPLTSGGPTTTSSLVYVHNDHLGTPQAITDANQQVVWQAEYAPFGQATLIANGITNNIRFPGQYFDNETGLHYNYFRYYEPSSGRYITSDPIGLAGGINTYAYAYQNPLGNYDPYGLDVYGINIGGGGTFYGKGAYSYQVLLDTDGNFAIQSTKEVGVGVGAAGGVFANLLYGTPNNIHSLEGYGTSISGSAATPVGGLAAAISFPLSTDYQQNECGEFKSYAVTNPGTLYEVGASFSFGTPELGTTGTYTKTLYNSSLLGDIGRYIGSTAFDLFN